jgi:hypothetical protein
MAKDKNEVKQYDIKVPVFLTDEKDSDENIDLFGSKMSSQMVSIVKEQIEAYNNNKSFHVTSDKRSKTSVTGIDTVDYTECKIKGVDCLLLQTTAYRTKLYDGYYQGEKDDKNIIVFKENDKLCSNTYFVLLYPKLTGLKSPYKLFWYVLVYDDPSKNNEDVTRVAKLIMKDILKYPIRNIKEPSLLSALRENKLINKVEISLYSITEDDNEVDVYLKDYKYECKLKKEKKIFLENIPSEVAEKIYEDEKFKEDFNRKQVKYFLNNKQVLTMTAEYRENLKRTLEDSFNYTFPVTAEQINSAAIFKQDFILEKLEGVLTNFLSLNDKINKDV